MPQTLLNPRLIIADIRITKISLKTLQKQVFFGLRQDPDENLPPNFFVYINSFLKYHGSLNFELKSGFSFLAFIFQILITVLSFLEVDGFKVLKSAV